MPKKQKSLKPKEPPKKAFKYRIEPSKEVKQVFNWTLEKCCEINEVFCLQKETKTTLTIRPN